MSSAAMNSASIYPNYSLRTCLSFKQIEGSSLSMSAYIGFDTFSYHWTSLHLAQTVGGELAIILTAQQIDPLDQLPSQSWLPSVATLHVDLAGQILRVADSTDKKLHLFL
jgi:hypothetical protein